MKRNLTTLENGNFDIVIIGGGITGACLAYDAALRGLSVALVEKNDFGAATSSASSKLLHGGIRYLQQLNIHKVRESAKERIFFQQLAPHLTHYIPFVIPTYSGFSKGRLVMNTAMRLYEIICAGLNRILKDPSKKVPGSRFLSRDDVMQVLPDIRSDRLTGGVAFYESHMHSSERMTLGFIESARHHGAVVANYVQAEAFLGADEGKINGLRVRDSLTGQHFDIRTSMVVNAAGPWIPLLNRSVGDKAGVAGVVNAFSKGAHIVTRPLTKGYALALPTRKQNQAVINRGGRHVFIIPWRGYSLIGTTYGPYEGDLDAVGATNSDIEEMIEDINSALGNEVLSSKDVLHAYAGIYPLIDDVIDPSVYQGTGDYQIIDHAEVDGLTGLVSVFGAKFTTARLLAEKSLDLIMERMKKTPVQCKTRNTRLDSGNIEDMPAFRAEQKRRYGSLLPESVIDNLVTNYGTKIHAVMKLIENESSLAKVLTPGRPDVAAEIVYAARHEMACHLDDVVFRRTGIGTLGNPGKDVLQECAVLMAKELGWDERKITAELTHTLSGFPADG